MKKKIAFFIILLLLSINAYNCWIDTECTNSFISIDKTPWLEVKVPGAISYSDWNCMASSADGKILVAAEYFGYVYISKDRGLTWEEAIGAGYGSWKSIAMSSDGTKLAAVYDDFILVGFIGYIYITKDAGQTWMLEIKAGEREWESIVVSSDCKVIVAVANGENNIYIYKN